MQLTRILDTLKDSDGALAQGCMVIHVPAFLQSDNTPIAAGKLEVAIVAGAVDIQLAATAGSSANADGLAAKYTVEYFLTNSGGYKETWSVPATGPITISQARGTV